MEYIIIILLCVISATTLILLFRATDAARRHALLTDDIAGCCESLGFVGCSVICSGVKSLSHIEKLLGQEYDRYEVIVTLDAEEFATEFREIVARYRMIRVNCTTSEELPTAFVRALYRSRQRCFRRLILVDKAYTNAYDDLDAATSVASYNYLLPAGSHTLLCTKAVEHIAITLSEQSAHDVELFYSKTTDSYIFQRDAIIANGGFSPHIIRQIPPSAHRHTYLPLTFNNAPRTSRLPLLAGAAALLCLVFAVAGSLSMVAVAMTMVMILAAANYLSRLTAPIKCSLPIMLCYFSKMAPIFRRKKFRFS